MIEPDRLFRKCTKYRKMEYIESISRRKKFKENGKRVSSWLFHFGMADHSNASFSR